MGDSSLEIKNVTTQEITTIRVDSGTYVASVTLASGDDVLVTVKKKGLAFISTYISSHDTLFSSPSELDIDMQSLEEGKSFNIDNIYFDNDSYELKYAAKEVVIEFSKYLQINKDLIIEINGFTDDIGDESYNQLLSENRAKAVTDLILMQGVSQQRVFYNGFGESFPVFTNETEKGRGKNRRTEFKVISQ